MQKYGGREVQTKITNCETLLQSLRQLYILENIFTYHKNNLQVPKQMYISENKLTTRKTLLQTARQIYILENIFTYHKT